jgi:LmbE family N-acetylglucosaminyl deacetylase
MFALSITRDPQEPLRLLCLGCHSDDIEIGCGGTILRLLRSGRRVDVTWVVFSSGPKREKEARDSAQMFLRGADQSTVIVKDFKDGFFPYQGAEIKAFVEELKGASPDIIFTHNRKDAHQDHRLIAELTWNTYRNHFVLEYEIPKYDGDLGQPNVFVPLQPEDYEKKIQCLLEAFETQRNKHWFERQTFLALMRLRGMECNSPSGYAEAFYGRKIVL